jgi:hypothetical protein
LVIAGISLLAVAGLHPSVRMAERFLRREGIVDEPTTETVETGVAAMAS